jgi:hypothetical protein
VWAVAHPEVFDMLYGDENFRLFRVHSRAAGSGPPVEARENLKENQGGSTDGDRNSH